MSNNKNIFRVRKFLNNVGHHEGAFILAEIERSEYKGKKNKKTGKTKPSIIYHSYTLKIADCSRIISLELDSDTKIDFKNSIHKLNILIDTLKQFKNTMGEENKKLEKLIKEGKARREKY